MKDYSILDSNNLGQAPTAHVIFQFSLIVGRKTMGHVYVKALFQGERGSHGFERVLVDTGATLSILPTDVAERIGLPPSPYMVELTLADNRRVKANTSIALLSIGDRSSPVQVAFFQEATPVIGVEALELLGMRVNPVTGQLELCRASGALLI